MVITNLKQLLKRDILEISQIDHITNQAVKEIITAEIDEKYLLDTPERRLVEEFLSTSVRKVIFYTNEQDYLQIIEKLQRIMKAKRFKSHGDVIVDLIKKVDENGNITGS